MSQAFSLYGESYGPAENCTRISSSAATEIKGRMEESGGARSEKRSGCERKACRWASSSGCSLRWRCCTGRHPLMNLLRASTRRPLMRFLAHADRPFPQAWRHDFLSTHFMNEAERCDRISLMISRPGAAVGSAGNSSNSAAALYSRTPSSRRRQGEPTKQRRRRHRNQRHRRNWSAWSVPEGADACALRRCRW